MKRNARETEKRILEAAIQIFSQKGFAGATTSEIAKAAEVAEGTIFKYYPKKKDLLHAAVLKAVDLFGESIAVDTLKRVIEENKEQSVEQLLKAVIMDRVKLFNNYFPLLKVIFYEMQFHEDVKELFLSKISKNVLQIGNQIFEKGKIDGDFKNVDAFIAIRSFLGMVMAMLFQRAFLPQDNVFDNIEEEINTLIDIFLEGIKRR